MVKDEVDDCCCFIEVVFLGVNVVVIGVEEDGCIIVVNLLIEVFVGCYVDDIVGYMLGEFLLEVDEVFVEVVVCGCVSYC